MPVAAATATALGLADIRKAYGATKALDAVSFEVEAGNIHALLGGNGCGKSTLIKILAGVVMADSGDITIGDRSLRAAVQTPARAAAAGLRFVHQQQSTFDDLTVAENLALGHGYDTGFAGRIRWRATHRRATDILERFEIDAAPGQEMRSLSSARQMMVTVARALQDRDASSGGVLVLDEPTARLPRHEVDLLLRSLQRYASVGHTILYVTHRLAEVTEVCHRATVLRDGRLVATVEGDRLSHDELVELITGRRIKPEARSQSTPASQRKGSAALLRLDGSGLDGRPLEIRGGEVLGVAGLMGSGRTAFLRRLFGSGHPEDPELTLSDGTPLGRSPGQAMRAGVAYVPEDRLAQAAFADLTITENLSIAHLEAYSRPGRVSARAERRAARSTITAFGVRAASEQAPLSSLSGGNQQKVILARWLQRKPRLLLLDEPSQGVDVGARADIHQMVFQAAADGAAVVLVSSDFTELVAVSDRVVVLQDGAIVNEIEGRELSEDRLNAAVYRQE